MEAALGVGVEVLDLSCEHLSGVISVVVVVREDSHQAELWQGYEIRQPAQMWHLRILPTAACGGICIQVFQ